MTEHHHQAVALVLVDRSAVPARDRVEQPQTARHGEVGALGADGVRERREAGDADERDRGTHDARRRAGRESSRAGSSMRAEDIGVWRCRRGAAPAHRSRDVRGTRDRREAC